MSEKIEIEKETAQVLFDALVQSMDFGSGFLDTDEVKALRSLAEVIGVDPNTATPDDFKRDFPHPFTVRFPDRSQEHCHVGGTFRPCAKPADHPIHQVKS